MTVVVKLDVGQDMTGRGQIEVAVVLTLAMMTVSPMCHPIWSAVAWVHDVERNWPDASQGHD